MNYAEISLAELAEIIGHSEHCVSFAHENLQEAGHPDWDEAKACILDALNDGDVTCQCD